MVAIVGALTVPGLLFAALFFGGIRSAIFYLPVVTYLPWSAIGMLYGIVALVITIRKFPRFKGLDKPTVIFRNIYTKIRGGR